MESWICGMANCEHTPLKISGKNVEIYSTGGTLYVCIQCGVAYLSKYKLEQIEELKKINEDKEV